MMRVLVVIVGLVCMVWMGGCTHVAGVVTKMDGYPLSTAVFSIGRPTDIANYGTHRVDGSGRFDFYISPTDETNLFLYDGAGAPGETIRQIERSQIGGNMRIRMTPIIPDADPAMNQVQ